MPLMIERVTKGPPHQLRVEAHLAVRGVDSCLEVQAVDTGAVMLSVGTKVAAQQPLTPVVIWYCSSMPSNACTSRRGWAVG